MYNWKKYKLGEVVSIKYGKDHKNLNDGPYPVYGSGGIMRYVDKYLYDKESILIPRKGSLNNIFYRDNAFWTVDTMFWSEINTERVFPEFLYYQLSLVDFENLNVGSAVPSLTIPIINDVDVSLPSLDEQKRIAGVLSSLDDKIDLLNRENATLEALAETLFRHYFIETPNPAWKEGKLGDYVIETIGGEWGTEVPEGESNMPVRCLRGADVADLNDGIATRTPLRYIKPSKFEKIKPNNGDIILEISGGTDTCSTGRVAYINDSVKHLFDYPIVFSNFCRLLRVKEEYMYFIYCYFRYLHKQGEFFNLENGSSGIHNLNYKAALYDDLGWPVPTDRKWVIEFGEKVKPYFDKINTNKKQSLSLSAQRDTLLPRLMSGEVKVTEL
jgi:type I restriction enzyme S subunit